MTQLLNLIEGKDGSEAISIIHELCACGCHKAYSYHRWDDASIYIFFNKDNSEFTMLWFQYLPNGNYAAALKQCVRNQLRGFHEFFLQAYPRCTLLQNKGIGEVYMDVAESPIDIFLNRMFMAHNIE